MLIKNTKIIKKVPYLRKNLMKKKEIHSYNNSNKFKKFNNHHRKKTK